MADILDVLYTFKWGWYRGISIWGIQTKNV